MHDLDPGPSLAMDSMQDTHIYPVGATCNGWCLAPRAFDLSLYNSQRGRRMLDPTHDWWAMQRFLIAKVYYIDRKRTKDSEHEQ
jgi:hypothetical protein